MCEAKMQIWSEVPAGVRSYGKSRSDPIRCPSDTGLFRFLVHVRSCRQRMTFPPGRLVHVRNGRTTQTGTIHNAFETLSPKISHGYDVFREDCQWWRIFWADRHHIQPGRTHRMRFLPAEPVHVRKYRKRLVDMIRCPSTVGISDFFVHVRRYTERSLFSSADTVAVREYGETRCGVNDNPRRTELLENLAAVRSQQVKIKSRHISAPAHVDRYA